MTISDTGTGQAVRTGMAQKDLRAAGREAADRHKAVAQSAAAMDELRRHVRHLTEALARRQAERTGESGRWLFENFRLVRSAARDVSDAAKATRELPAVTVAGESSVSTRAYAAARDLLAASEYEFSDDIYIAFLSGYQERCELQMAELWAMRPELELVLLEQLADGPAETIPTLLASLRRISEAQWQDLFEATSVVERILERDPAGAYAAMEADSRDTYRNAITDIAKRSDYSEHEVAEMAIAMARQTAQQTRGDTGKHPGFFRRTHVGFYLIDAGLPALRRAAGYRPSFPQRLRDALLKHPNGFYLSGIEIVTFVIVIGLLTALDSLTPVLAGFFLLILPATQAAVEFMNHLTTSLLRPRPLPKLDFSEGVPEEFAALVAVPALLLNEEQVRGLALDLEIRFLANRDPNVSFALVTDCPDADRPEDERDKLAELCCELIDGLNRTYGNGDATPFYLFHRHRIYNASEGRWMGWERKRGKLLDLNQLLRGRYDSFPVKAGNMRALSGVRYVITLDSDTQLPRGAAARLVGAMAHPLNRPVVDAARKIVAEGYAILQPRIGISVESASRSRLASIYSGQTGFDIYTRAVSDVYQDLYGRGIFTGKGIYDIDALEEVLQHRFPDNTLLSHDLIEGSYARAGLVSDIELIDDYPSHFSAYSRRKHRWVRGDWQITRWLRASVPDFHGRITPNPIAPISRWQILDNLRRSVIEPATLLLFLAGWFYLPGGALYWTAVTLAMLFMPVVANLLFSLLRVPWRTRLFGAWFRDTIGGFAKGSLMALLNVIFLLHQALLSIDAIVRSVMRVSITRRKLLEWETAAEAESAVRRKSTVDIYFEWTPWIAAALGLVLFLVRPAALPEAAPVLLLWFVSRAISYWLNRPPRTSNRQLRGGADEMLRESAEKIWRFFHDWSSPATNWLIPDSVRENGTAVHRLSPTNLGMLLNARVAAVQLGFLDTAAFIFETLQTLDTVSRLPKYRGHLYNWYDGQTLQPLEPRFVSTVDSGNLVAALWTLRQAALASAKQNRRDSEEQVSGLLVIANRAGELAAAMDFSFLYHRRKKVLSVGYDAGADRLEPSSYDLLASESRIACFVAIAKGDIPQEAWFHLGRSHTLYRGARVLISWTGTMFEYLMPMLWMRHYADTITGQSATEVVRAQKEFARSRGVPWGISESACRGEEGGDYGYCAFGVPALAMKQTEVAPVVISPYSTFLALAVEPRAAVENLKRMVEYGWTGHYGFYEAIDYTSNGAEVIRSWMAHHQGMSLLAICNALFDNPLQRYFHAAPEVMATELLLNERVPSSLVVEEEPAPALVPEAAAAAS